MSAMSEELHISRLIRDFGPVKAITRARERQLISEGKSNHVLTLVQRETSFFDLPEEERPSKQELEERGETEEEFSRVTFVGVVGHHVVNMYELYEFEKPLPEDLLLDDDSIDFGEGGLPG